MKYNRREVRKLINALTKKELDESIDDFPSVRGDFTDAQEQHFRVNIVLNHFEKHQEEFPNLLEAIKEVNLTAYNNYVSESGNSEKLESNKKNYKTIESCEILVLAANPIDTDILQLEEEVKKIKQEVGESYIVKVEEAVKAEDLSKYLMQYKPRIVHFSGHGNPSGEIILNNEQGQSQPVCPVALAELLDVVGGRIECVVLNACFSLEKADALVKQVSCVIGMSAEVDDESAVKFAEGFYRGLGFKKGYYTAFEVGRSQVKLLNLPDSAALRFIPRDASLLEEEEKPRVTRTVSPQSAAATLYPLWFGTDRQPCDPQDVSKGFSGERSQQLHYGTCKVAVPKSHKIGSTGSSWWQRLLTSTDDRLNLKQGSLNLLDETSFFAHVQQALQEHDLDERSALVFIHGFNVSFEDAALRAAQIGFDLQVRGIMAFYSWPSKGKLIGYDADKETIEASAKYIAEFLLKLAQKSGAKKIHIIAHSMGNRGLLRAMQQILAQVQAESGILFGQIFLAAPDVDRDLFRDLAKAYRNLAERTTLYVSAKDKALETSGIIHDYPRVGFSPPITVAEGIDTVEVSNIDLTFLGHGYYAAARTLLNDIHNLLMHNSSPRQRFGLEEAQEGEQKYWIIKQ